MKGEALRLLPVLILLGAGWGATQPLSKIAVSTGHAPMGLAFWQLAISALFLGAITLVRRRSLPMGMPQIRMYLVISMLGTLLPNVFFYTAIKHLPAGLMSILISAVPLFAFPIALLLGVDRFSPGRFLGLLFGIAAVALIAAPESSLPDRAMLAFLPIALVAPFLYALEGNVVARWGTAGVGPIRLLLGASITGAVIAGPIAYASGQWVDLSGEWGPPEMAIVAASVIHAIVYTLYVWLVQRAGAVYAAQTAYLVTGFGVVWAMLFLGERYSGWIWAALALMFIGLTLVRPRKADPVAETREGGKDTA